MFKLDFITSILHLPERSLSLIKDNTFILTLPVVLHKCPHCNKWIGNTFLDKFSEE